MKSKFTFEISSAAVHKHLNDNHWLGNFYIPYIFHPQGCFQDGIDFGIDRYKFIDLIVDSDELLAAMQNNWKHGLYPLYGLEEHAISPIAKKAAKRYPGCKEIVKRLKKHSDEYRASLNGSKIKNSIEELQKLGYIVTK